MIKQKNPENTFYLPYLQPLKANVKSEIQKGVIELENFVLPKEASIYIDESGAERIFIDGLPVSVMTEIPSGIVYLMNQETCIQMERHVQKKENIISFRKSKIA